MAFSQQDPVEKIARHQHECWVAWAKSMELSMTIPENVLRKWEAQFVPFDLLAEHVQEAYRRRARHYVGWVREGLSLS